MNAAEKQIARFEKLVNASLSSYLELLLAVHNKKNQATLENLLVEQFVLSLGVAWESFIHDILLAYVTMEPARYLVSLRNRIRKSVEDRYGWDAMKAVVFKFPDLITRARAAALIDPKQWNITAGSGHELAKRANELLSATHAIKFSLDVNDAAFVDYLIALRNFLGHYSAGSRERLKETISALNAGVNAPLFASLRQIGPYLKARHADGNTRAAFIAARMLEIAEKLA
jgi:hypothetical protein